MAGAETVQTTHHPNDLAEAWAGMIEELGDDVEMLPVDTEVKGSELVEPSLGDDLVQTEPDRYRTNLDNRLALENQERMMQSEAEMAEFERKLGLSPEEYWQELRDGYAQSGINLGLMPDVREMREYAQGHLEQSIGGGEQGERAELALKTELGRMAQEKAEEIRRWQSEGRGLPITFESEWVKSGQNDIRNLLEQFYEVDEKLSRDARLNGGLTGDEQVAWMMATLPRRPRVLDAVWTFKSNQGRFEGETTTEYYNRLKNYRTQDQMRDWQIGQDAGKVIVHKSEEEILGEEAMLAEEERAKDSEGVEEAIRETDREVMEIWQEREKVGREEIAKEVVKKPGFLRVVKKLVTKFVDSMRIESMDEEDYEEMERQEKEEVEAEETAETDVVAEETEVSEEESKPRMMEVDGIKVEMLTPEQIEKYVAYKRRAEQMLDDVEKRSLIMADYKRLVALLDAYDKANNGDMSEVIDYQTQKALGRHESPKVDEKDDKETTEFAQKFNAFWLQQKGLFSGEMNEEGLKELKATKTRLVSEMFDNVRNENSKEVRENVLAEYREKLRAVDGMIDWLEQEFGPETKTNEQSVDSMPLAETA